MDVIDEKQLALLTERIAEAVHPSCIFLYGSHAYGSPTPDSDIDLLLVIEDETTPVWQVACDAYRALRGSAVPIELKVVTAKRFGKQKKWRSSVEWAAVEKGRVLYGRVS